MRLKLPTKKETEMTYHNARFQKKIEVNKKGDTDLAEKTIKELDSICEDFGGMNLSYKPHWNPLTGQLLQREDSYLVGACFVTNDINLLAGTTTTDISYANGFKKPNFEMFYQKFKKFYDSMDACRTTSTRKTKSENLKE